MSCQPSDPKLVVFVPHRIGKVSTRAKARMIAKSAQFEQFAQISRKKH